MTPIGGMRRARKSDGNQEDMNASVSGFRAFSCVYIIIKAMLYVGFIPHLTSLFGPYAQT